jgi:NAD(P)-dependent dehydrogenase (short-subunit alcohol dehydrogenase family)
MNPFPAEKIALVTGGTRGIGREIARALALAGAKVTICGRTDKSVRQAISELKSESGVNVQGCATDITSKPEVDSLFDFMDRLGGIDILINNAGIGIFRSVADLTYEDWRRTLDTNLTGAYLCSHNALARFRNRGGGFIVNISSLAGKNPFAGGAAYNASKFGLNGFAEAMMLDHRHDNVRVSNILPGSVSTEFNSGAGADWKIAPEDIAEIVMAILRMPERTLVSSVEVRPSKPRK